MRRLGEINAFPEVFAGERRAVLLHQLLVGALGVWHDAVTSGADVDAEPEDIRVIRNEIAEAERRIRAGEAQVTITRGNASYVLERHWGSGLVGNVEVVVVAVRRREEVPTPAQ